MNGKPYHTLLFVLAWLTTSVQAQLPWLGIQDVEDLLYRDESLVLPEYLLESGARSGVNPLDLNHASREELEASGMFTTYQIHHLLNYRETYGPLYSVYELASLPGFHHADLHEIQSLVRTGSGGTTEPDFKRSHQLLIDMERSFPLEEDYRVESGSGDQRGYKGAPARVTFRLRSQPWKHLSVALTFDKDAGECLLYRGRPQFLSGYLSYTGNRFLKQLVIGNFRLNQGVGLVNGSGLFHRVGNFRVNSRSLSRISPYASRVETNYDQGLACKMGSGKLHLLIWGSAHPFSLSPATLTADTGAEEWFGSQRTSGLFRTSGELEGRDLAFRLHTGIQLQVTSNSFSLGILHGTEYMGPTRKALAYLDERINPALQLHSSLHGSWSRQKIQVFGELAACRYRSLALLFGSVVHFNDFIEGSLLAHYYGAGYSGSLPSAYGSGSNMRPEQGVAFFLHVETGPIITARLTGELFRYPTPRYLTRVPSVGYRVELSLQNPGSHVLQWKVRGISKAWQSTPASEASEIRPLKDLRTNRLDGQWTYTHLDRFRWLGRLVVSNLNGTAGSVPGYAAVQRITVGGDGKLKVTAQVILFHVKDWENRIYLYEPGFYYSFNFPVCYGTGRRTAVLVTMKPASRMTISVRYAGMFREGNRSREVGLQLRFNLNQT